MSVHKEFYNEFFQPFAELCASSQQLTSVTGQFLLQGKVSSPIAIELGFQDTSVLMTAEEDDSISLKWNNHIVDAEDCRIRTLDAVAPWDAAISRPLLWAWIMINQQGFFDGLQFDFAETTDAPVTTIQLLVVASEFKYR